MKIHILGEANPEPVEINTEGWPIGDMLKKFLDYYNRENPSFKGKPILLTFDKREEGEITLNGLLRYSDENEYAYKLRMFDNIAEFTNKRENLVGGFNAVFTSETSQQKTGEHSRRLGITFYQFPSFTTSVDELQRPSGWQYHHILGRIIPPSM